MIAFGLRYQGRPYLGRRYHYRERWPPCRGHLQGQGLGHHCHCPTFTHGGADLGLPHHGCCIVSYGLYRRIGYPMSTHTKNEMTFPSSLQFHVHSCVLRSSRSIGSNPLILGILHRAFRVRSLQSPHPAGGWLFGVKASASCRSLPGTARL